MRTAIKLAIAAVALGAMAWCCLFIYWHLKISNAIRQLEAETESVGLLESESFLFLRYNAVCRALPHLVAYL